jgi:hypothetical protein
MTKSRLDRITTDDAQCGGRPCIRRCRSQLRGDSAGLPGSRTRGHPRVNRVCRPPDRSFGPSIRVKFLVDNQLPPALARFISEDLGAKAVHVADVGLRDGTDAAPGVLRLRTPPPQGNLEGEDRETPIGAGIAGEVNTSRAASCSNAHAGVASDPKRKSGF